MREFLVRAGKLATVVGAALLMAGCGGDSDRGSNDTAANALDGNLMLDEPGNDASAMEAAANATEPEPAPAANSGAEATDSTDPLGDTSGGDTGGNTVESNVSAM